MSETRQWVERFEALRDDLATGDLYYVQKWVQNDGALIEIAEGIARLTAELEESRRERSAARAEALTAQASLRRIERELEEARERERGYREALYRALDRGFPGDTHEGDCAVTRGMQCDCWIGQARALVTTPDTEGET